MTQQLPQQKYKVCAISTLTHSMIFFVLTQMYCLKERGLDVTIVCNMDDEFKSLYEKDFTCVSIPFTRGVNPWNALICILALYRLFKQQKYDLIQYTTPNASFYAAIAGWAVGIPARVYCQWGIRYVGFTAGIKRTIFRCLEQITCKCSTNVTMDSKSNLQFGISEHLYDDQKASVIWNGSVNGVNLEKYDLSRKQERRARTRRKHGIPTDAFVFGYLGRVIAEKGVNDLLIAAREMMKHNENIYVMLVGQEDPTDMLDEELLQWARQHPRMCFCGYTLTAEEYYPAFDAFVFPSTREGSACGMMHAGALQIPTLTSNIPCLTETIEEGVTAISFALHDTAALLAAMERIYADPDLRAKIGKGYYKCVLRDFEHQEFMRRYHEYITTLISTTQRGN